MPKCLVERFDLDTLNYIAEAKVENGKHYLGTLAGPAAEFTKPTRNGRKYNLQLWKNVENSDDFKEGMATLTILGETDHPDDRLETKIKEVAIVLRKWEIKEQEGIVYCEFDILDTPNGRILKELLDYGCKIGVSSRGSGEEIVQNGETIIDPDTYFFICFDAVITPAVAKARPEIVEGCVGNNSNKSSLLESIQNEISNATTQQELESIKSIISATNLPELDSVKESIDKKLDLIGNGDTISSKLIKELGESASKIEELESKIEDLKETHKADNIRMKEMRDLIKRMNSNSKNLSKCLRDSKVHSSHLEEDIILMTEQSSDYDGELTKLREQVNKYHTENRTLKLKNHKLESKISQLEETTGKRLNESKQRANRTSILYESACEEIMKLQNELSESKKAISKFDKIEENFRAKLKIANGQNASLIKENEAYKSRYVQMKAVQCGFSSETVKSRLPENYRISDVDRVVSELSDKKDRISKVPVAIPVSGVIYKESTMPEFIDEESDQTIKMLKAFKESNK